MTGSVIAAYDLDGTPNPAKNGTVTPSDGLGWEYIPQYTNSGSWTPDTDWTYVPNPSYSGEWSAENKEYLPADTDAVIENIDSPGGGWDYDGYGPELVTNGGFDTDSDWTLGTGWAITGGNAVFSGAAGANLQQGVGLLLDVRYLVELDYTTDISIQVRMGSGTAADTILPGSGSYSSELVAAGAADFILRAVAAGNVLIDNVSVREVGG